MKAFYLGDDVKKHKRRGGEVRQGRESNTYRTHEWAGYHGSTQSHGDPLRYSGECAPKLFTRDKGAGDLIHRSYPALAEGPRGCSQLSKLSEEGRGRLRT